MPQPCPALDLPTCTVAMHITKQPGRGTDVEFARSVHHRAYRDVVVAQYGLWNEEAQDEFFIAAWSLAPHEVILCDDVRCGYMCVEDRDHDIFIRELVIDPVSQGKGIGTHILRDVIERAIARGVPVRLVTQRLNRAVNLYCRLGFRESGRTDSHILMEWKRGHDLNLVKESNPPLQRKVVMSATTIILAGLVLTTSAFAANSANIDSPSQREAAAIIQQLRDFPPWWPANVRSDGTMDLLEKRREELYGRLRRLGDDALPALARGLSDPDVRIRRNVALVLNILAGKWYKQSEPALNIRPCLSALIAALKDSDASVRARAAHAIGVIGKDAARAIPALLILLRNTDEGSRNGACIALRGIGPAAKRAIPALRHALDDPSKDVRQFARQAIDSILPMGQVNW